MTAPFHAELPYVLTNSELQSWQHCHRCWYLGYYRCLSAIREYRKPLSVGTLFHHAMEGYYGGRHEPFEYLKTKSVEMIEANPDAADAIAKDAEMVGIMVDGYMEELASTGMDADLEVYAAEEKVEAQLITRQAEYILRGKLDARAFRRSTGTRVFIEHKTCQSFPDLIRTAQTNQQFLTYELLEYLGMMERGEDPDGRADGVLLNMARKVKRTARAKPPFYKRHEVRYNLAELRNHYRHIVATANEIMAARARLDGGESVDDVCVPTSTRECFWKCNFSSLCMSGIMDDGSDWEGYVADLYETVDPLKRYEEEEEDDGDE